MALQVANRDYANWADRMSPWPVEDPSPRSTCRAPATPTSSACGSTASPTCATCSSAPAPARPRRAWPAARCARPCCARSGSRSAATSCASAPSRCPSATRRWRSEDFAGVDDDPVRALDAEASRAMVAAHQRAAEGQRVDRRHVRGHRLRPGARPGLARQLGGAPRRPRRRRAVLDPGGQGRRLRRRLRPARAARLAGPRRDLQRGRATTSATRTAPAGWRAA